MSTLRNLPRAQPDTGISEALKFPKGTLELDWKPESQKTLVVYNFGFTNQYNHRLSRPCLSIVCTEFSNPEPEWKYKSWLIEGGRSHVYLPAYAIKQSDAQKLKKDLDTYFESNFQQLLNELPNGQDEIVSLVVNETKRHWEKVSSRILLSTIANNNSMHPVRSSEGSPRDCSHNETHTEEFQYHRWRYFGNTGDEGSALA